MIRRQLAIIFIFIAFLLPHAGISNPDKNGQLPSWWEDFVNMMHNSSCFTQNNGCVLCGYVRDEETMQPIKNATIYVAQNYSLKNVTSQDDGFYIILLPPGQIYIYCNAVGYYFNRVGQFILREGQTLWLNISMRRTPPQNAVVYGYVKCCRTATYSCYRGDGMVGGG